MVDFGPLKMKWRELAETKARVKGMRGIMKEGIGVNMVEYYVQNLENQTKVKMGQGREEKEIVKNSVQKIIRDLQRQVRLGTWNQKRMREDLKADLGQNLAKFKRTIMALNKEAQQANQLEMEKYQVKTKHQNKKHGDGLQQREQRVEDKPILALGKFKEYSKLYIYQTREINNKLEEELNNRRP